MEAFLREQHFWSLECLLMVKITVSFHHAFNRNMAGRFLILMTAQKVDVISTLPSFYKWETERMSNFAKATQPEVVESP